MLIENERQKRERLEREQVYRNALNKCRKMKWSKREEEIIRAQEIRSDK